MIHKLGIARTIEPQESIDMTYLEALWKVVSVAVLIYLIWNISQMKL